MFHIQSTLIVLIINIDILISAASLKCFANRSLTTYYEVPISDPSGLLKSKCYRTGLPTVIFTFGYKGQANGPATTTVLRSLQEATEPRNVLLLDWEDEAASGMLGFALGYAFKAAPNAKMVGKALGDALVTLIQGGMNASSVHLIGHSLGAHLMGAAGRRSLSKGFMIGRITGLDPARALFEYPFAMKDSILDKNCAKFVDIVHTDPGNYGVEGSYGTVDIWPNYDKGKPQPGCEGLSGATFSREDLCSHDRAWRYLAESMRKPDSFLAISSNTLPDLRRATAGVTLLGPYADIRARGNYYLSTNAHAPYGKKETGLYPLPIDGPRTYRRRRLVRNNRFRNALFG